MIFDTHAHYDDEAFSIDRDELIVSLKENGVLKVMNIAATMQSVETTLALSEKYDFFYAAIGVHPEGIVNLTDADMQRLEELSKNEKVRAIGEIGLDYHYEDLPREIQIKWFREQICLARRVRLPMVIHSRDAAADTIEIMKEEHAEEIGGIVHCFSYSKEIAEVFLKMGFYIGIGGVVTFKNSKKLVEALSVIPLDRIVIETDCPYLAPDPYRGTRNTSLNLPLVVKKIAEIKGVSEEEVINATWKNAHDVYRLRF